jgi:hypothetical protein
MNCYQDNNYIDITCQAIIDYEVLIFSKLSLFSVNYHNLLTKSMKIIIFA